MSAVLKIVGMPRADTGEALKGGSEAQGAALAESILKWEGEKLVKGKRYLQDIANLDNPGRKVLRTTLIAHLQAFRDEGKQWQDTPQAALFKARVNILSVRVSEYTRFATACDNGFEPVFDDGYAEILAAARCFLRATADMVPEGSTYVGPTRLRGRKATSNAEKFVKYLEKMGPSLEDLEQFAKIIRLTIKAAKDEAAAEATEAASIDAEQGQAANVH